FLSMGNVVKVRLSVLGESMMKGLTDYRPKFIKRDGDIFYFEAANENAKMYFRGFMKEAEILEPLSLREEMKQEYQEVLKLYENKN
ncbi:WYL domain-containing protein, partial [Fusobacterium sp.]|nr:WYL domain-containing protein [Fusobacterium sp.]